MQWKRARVYGKMSGGDEGKSSGRVTRRNITWCGNHFTIYTNIKSLCCIPETNIMSCHLYFN